MTEEKYLDEKDYFKIEALDYEKRIAVAEYNLKAAQQTNIKLEEALVKYQEKERKLATEQLQKEQSGLVNKINSINTKAASLRKEIAEKHELENDNWSYHPDSLEILTDD